MTALLIYLAIGVGNAALVWNCFGRPKGIEWLWLPAQIVLWPLVVAVLIYVAAGDRGY